MGFGTVRAKEDEGRESESVKYDNCGVCGGVEGERKTNMEGFDVLARWASLVRATAGISRCAFFWSTTVVVSASWSAAQLGSSSVIVAVISGSACSSAKCCATSAIHRAVLSWPSWESKAAHA